MNTFTRTWLLTLVATLAIALALPADAFAAPRNDPGRQSPRQYNPVPSMPSNATSRSREDAARQAARQYDAAKVLSVKTVQQGNRRVHVVKLLTKDGVVKTVRVPADGR